jgi:menaquinone-specific isochorismate synthase
VHANEIAALREKLAENAAATGITTPDALWVGGIAFDYGSVSDDIWQEFPSIWFFLPAVAVRREDRELSVCSFDESVDAAGLAHEFSGLDANDPGFIKPRLLSHRSFPAEHQWAALVKEALGQIESGLMRKVVLARRSDFLLDSEPAAHQLLQSSLAEAKGRFGFLIQPEPRVAFLGTSPERLVSLDHGQVSSEALAGTMSVDDGQRLLSDEKNRREQQIVLETVTDWLNEVCSDVTVASDPELVQAADVVHLRTKITARLAQGSDAFHLLSKLQPPPATGGLPRSQAMAFLREHEPFYRGWYAGAVGWLWGDQADFTVAIRSMLLRGKTLHGFAGAGIVPGSHSVWEWQELNRKQRPLERLLHSENEP